MAVVLRVQGLVDMEVCMLCDRAACSGLARLAVCLDAVWPRWFTLLLMARVFTAPPVLCMPLLTACFLPSDQQAQGCILIEGAPPANSYIHISPAFCCCDLHLDPMT